MTHKEFEVLAVDESNSSTIETEEQFAHSVLSNGRISSSGKFDASKNDISLGSSKIRVSRVNPDSSHYHIQKAFLIRAKGPYQELEPLRENILAHMNKQGFSPIYILCDQVSEEIACTIYPHIYAVENALRGYLIKFMSTRIGVKWWEATASGETRKKAQDRKSNEEVFSKYVDMKAYLIDFSDLGKIVYEQSSGFNSKDDVIKKVSECDETPEAIKKLKEELKSNYHKFFKEHFRDNDFQKKWESLMWYRNKVAHNNLFTEGDRREALELSASLIEIIQKASDTIPNIDMDDADKEAIIDAISERSGVSMKSISDAELMDELKKSEKHFDSPGKFVGLSYFARTHLASIGYDSATTLKAIERLEAEGKVEIYKTTHPTDQYEVTAIRSK